MLNNFSDKEEVEGSKNSLGVPFVLPFITGLLPKGYYRVECFEVGPDPEAQEEIKTTLVTTGLFTRVLSYPSRNDGVPGILPQGSLTLAL